MPLMIMQQFLITTDYVTIKDITSAPRGGRLHSIIGPATQTGTTNFKITVDGTEYIVPVSPLQTKRNCFLG